MQRRTVLFSGVSAIGLIGCSTTKVVSAPSDEGVDVPTIDPGTGPLSAVIEYQGKTIEYAEAGGTNLGDYEDPDRRFVQQCIRATSNQLPVVVYFRPDRTTNRAEVVFEYGDPWSKGPPQDLEAYRVTILRGGRQIATIAVPGHFWYSRWRWQSAPRPVVAKVSDLIKAGLLPHYDSSGLGRFTNDMRGPMVYSPMTMAGVTPNMGQTGERADIGPVTEWQADYICVGANLRSVLAQAEACGTINFHVRDPHTAAPIDLMNTYPKAGMYSPQGNSPFLARTGPKVGGRGLGFDTGHHPSLTYLPFLLTSDPYYLEELQFQVNATLMGPAGWHFNGKGRYLAWPLRDRFHAVKVTPPSVPKWLLPQSYFRAVLDGQRAEVTKYINNTSDPLFDVFRLITAGGSQSAPGFLGGTYFDPWQEDFIAFVFGWGVQMGFAEWTDALKWKIECTVARTNGTSGWPRANPSPYEITFQPGCTLTAAMTPTDTTAQVDFPQGFLGKNYVIMIDGERMLVTGGEETTSWTVTRGQDGTKITAHNKGSRVVGDKFKNWADCAASNLAINHKFEFMPGDPTGMNKLFHSTMGTVTYPGYTRGALAMAARLGVHSAVAPFAWIDEQMRAALSPQYHLDRKWMVT